MKKLVLLAMLVSLVVFPFISDAAVRVRGYTRKDGTYVAPHFRSDPDGIKSNNWSYPGNTNPFTGITAPGSSGSTYTPPPPSTYFPSFSCVPSSSYPGYYFNTLNWYYDSNCTQVYNPSIKSTCTLNAYLATDGKCYCNTGYVAEGIICTAINDYCKIKYGSGAWATGSTCHYCDAGYEADISKTQCVKRATQTTPTVTIQQLLAQIAALQKQLDALNKK